MSSLKAWNHARTWISVYFIIQFLSQFDAQIYPSFESVWQISQVWKSQGDESTIPANKGWYRVGNDEFSFQAMGSTPRQLPHQCFCMDVNCPTTVTVLRKKSERSRIVQRKSWKRRRYWMDQTYVYSQITNAALGIINYAQDW